MLQKVTLTICLFVTTNVYANKFIDYSACIGASAGVGTLMVMDSLPITSIFSSVIMGEKPPHVKGKDFIFTLADALGGIGSFVAETFVYAKLLEHTGADIQVPNNWDFYAMTKYPYKSTRKAYYNVFKSPSGSCGKL